MYSRFDVNEVAEYDKAVELAAINTGTFLCGSIPRVGIFKIVGPERPAPALAGPDRVNNTLFFTINKPQEDAVMSKILFDNRSS